MLGTLNLLDRAAVRRGLAAAEEGLVVPLNAPLTEFEPPLFGRAPLHHAIEEHARGRVRDEVLSGLNTQASSQWDGFRHVQSLEHGFYNGLTEQEHSIATWAQRGMVTRGVLLDAERWFYDLGRPLHHDRPHPIEVTDLEGMLAALPFEVVAGDILVLHTGWLEHQRGVGGPADKERFAAPGLRPSREMLRWVWDSHCAAIVADNPSLEAWPPSSFVDADTRARRAQDPDLQVEVFMHYELIALLGVAVGELWDTAHLAAECRRMQRQSFLLTSAPMNLRGGVASPANALAVL